MKNCANCIYLNNDKFCTFKNQDIEGDPVQQGCGGYEFKENKEG